MAVVHLAIVFLALVASVIDMCVNKRDRELLSWAVLGLLLVALAVR